MFGFSLMLAYEYIQMAIFVHSHCYFFFILLSSSHCVLRGIMVDIYATFTFKFFLF